VQKIVFEIVIGTPCATMQKIVIEIMIACSTVQKIVIEKMFISLVEDTC